MKLDERFHCFGCGADGDVIDFAARLFRLPVKKAAERLAADFGIAPGIPGPPPPPRKKSPAEECREVLLEMETMLHRQKRLTAPDGNNAAPAKAPDRAAEYKSIDFFLDYGRITVGDGLYEI